MINWSDIANYANGTCLSVEEIKAHYSEELVGIDNETIESKIEDEEVVRCENCGWFVEVSETDEDGYCEDCAPEYY